MKLRVVVMNTLPISGWHGEGENGCYRWAFCVFTVTEDVRVRIAPTPTFTPTTPPFTSPATPTLSPWWAGGGLVYRKSRKGS